MPQSEPMMAWFTDASPGPIVIPNADVLAGGFRLGGVKH